MSRLASQQPRGTVSLVALCFVAVLGIALASYLTVCSRAMNLSNRTFQDGLSRQLAEFGLEEGLRAFNKNNWGNWTSGGISVAWDTTTYVASKRAIGTITFPTAKFGQGVAASVKIRIDNYDAAVRSSIWNSSATYRINDLVGDNTTGSWLWYRCLKDNSTNVSTTNLSTWAPEPVPWAWSASTTYSQYDVVNYSGTWYRYFNSTASSGNLPTNTTYWNSIPAISLSWSTNTAYARGAIVFYSGDGNWYYCAEDHTSGVFATDLAANPVKWALLPTPAATTWRNGANYSVNDYVYRTGTSTWYRCTTAHSGQMPPGSNWAASASAPYISWAWRPFTQYYFNDLVYVTVSGNSNWYRCTTSHPGVASFSTTNWENALTGSSSSWSTNLAYNLGDAVYYNGEWYRCVRAHSSSQTPSSTSSYWTRAPLASMAWSPNKRYNLHDVVSYNGVWYLSHFAGTQEGRNPSDSGSTYWSAAPKSIETWSSTKTYAVNDMVSRSVSGVISWYRCTLGNTNQQPPSATYWAVVNGTSYAWDAATAYLVGNVCSYGGVWYKCTTANTSLSPNDSGAWTAAWRQSWQNASSSPAEVAGAPVIYAEASISRAGEPAFTVQLRAPIAPAPLFPNAVAATATVNAQYSTTGGTVDSYDGNISTFAAGGTYNSFTHNQTSSPFAVARPNLSYAAIIAAGSTTSPAVTLNNTTVKGYVAARSAATTPYAPMWSKGTNATLTGTSATGSVDLTRVSRSPSIPQFDIIPATGLATAFSVGNLPKGIPLPMETSVQIGTPGAPTPTRYYYDGTLTIGGGGATSITTLNIIGPVIIYINGDLRMTSTSGTTNIGTIMISQSGSAEIHFSGGIKVDSGSAGIINNARNTRSLVLISDNSASTLQYYGEGTNPLYGVLYIPKTTATDGLYFNYNETNTTVLYGAVSATNVSFRNNMIVHYDTSLRYATIPGVDQPYTVTELRELAPTEQATMP